MTPDVPRLPESEALRIALTRMLSPHAFGLIVPWLDALDRSLALREAEDVMFMRDLAEVVQEHAKDCIESRGGLAGHSNSLVARYRVRARLPPT